MPLPSEPTHFNNYASSVYAVKGDVMMYANKLAVALKSAGKVLREFKDTVYVPFGTEYSILIKNLNTRRVSVTLSIDGVDATENVSLLIDANSDMELTRFIKNGNLANGNRFKFIERSGSVEQHRGVGIEDGLIRVEFEFEREIPKIAQFDPWQHRIGSNGYNPDAGRWFSSTETYTSAASTKGLRSADLMNIAAVGNGITSSYSSTAVATAAIPTNDVGITVPGSVSDQQFHTTYGFVGDGVKHAIVLKLLGETDAGTPVVSPVTVKAKPACITCGRVNKATAKFCSNCGTSLVLV